MDIEKYIAGKDSGVSSIELQGESTLLIKWHGGFNESDGSPKPPIEQGFQPADIAAMKAVAQEAVQGALAAWQKAKARAAMFDDLEEDVAAVLTKAANGR